MRMLLLGPPGGGKGTQGARLSAQLGVAHIAVGDLLRREVSAETPLGVRVAEYMTRGELVPDELIIDALTPRLVAAEGFILDGFPRTLAQAQTADEAIPLDVVVYLNVREQELRRRLLGRADLEGRADDTPGRDRPPPTRLRGRDGAADRALPGARAARRDRRRAGGRGDHRSGAGASAAST
jgi:adenylate kinase